MNPTEAQLRELAAWLVRRVVESERGLRSPAQLTPLLTVVAQARLTESRRSRWHVAPAGPVLPADVRTVSVQKDTPHRAQAVVLVRRGSRWEAVHLQLVRDTDGWRIHDLRRPSPSLDHTPDPQPPEEAFRRLTSTRGAAAAAAEASRHRATEAPDDDRHRAEVARWTRVVADLDRQIAEIGERIQSADMVSLHNPNPPKWAVRVLGPRPTDPDGRRRWSKAAVALAAFRRQWGITEQERPLGALPTHPRQITDLDNLLQLLDQLSMSPPDQALL